jgi:hypothetical protein
VLVFDFGEFDHFGGCIRNSLLRYKGSC